MRRITICPTYWTKIRTALPLPRKIPLPIFPIGHLPLWDNRSPAGPVPFIGGGVFAYPDRCACFCAL